MMPLVIKKKQAVAAMSVEHKHKGGVVTEQHEQEAVGEPKQLQGPACVVGMEASLTLNLGNYNSAKIGCLLQMPCLHHEIDEAFEYCQNWVNERLQKMAADAQSEVQTS
jgi:hypothetical protein